MTKTLLVLANNSTKIIRWEVFQLSNEKVGDLYEIEDVTSKLGNKERLEKANENKGITKIDFKDGFLETSFGRGNADGHTKRLLGGEKNWVIYPIDKRSIKEVNGKRYYKP